MTKNGEAPYVLGTYRSSLARLWDFLPAWIKKSPETLGGFPGEKNSFFSFLVLDERQANFFCVIPFASVVKDISLDGGKIASHRLNFFVYGIAECDVQFWPIAVALVEVEFAGLKHWFHCPMLLNPSHLFLNCCLPCLTSTNLIHL